MKTYIIIGGGIIGCALARVLSMNKRGEVIVLEKESKIGMHASGRNSGVIHSGINQKPGSMKARMCVEGSNMLRNFCNENEVPFKECGTLVAANTEAEFTVLDNLLKMGQECNVPGLKIINDKEIRELEPASKGIKALFSPTGAVVDSQELVEKIAHSAQKAGAKILLQEKVIRIEGMEVVTEKNRFKATHIINAAGLYADKIAHMMGEGKAYKIIPFRGEYMEVEGVEVNSMIYQPPDLRFPFLSVHMTREIDGKILAGPTAVLSFGRESYEKEIILKESIDFLLDKRFYLMATKPSFLPMAIQAFKMSFFKKFFRQEIEKLVGSLPSEKVKPFRSGIRAQMVDSKGNFVDDHLVVFNNNSTQILNCVSPGMTSSLAFAKYLDAEIHKKASLL